MDNQEDKHVKEPSLFMIDRKKYYREYMNQWLKDRKVHCECGCLLFPHAVKKHKESLKHKYLMLTRA